MTELELKYGCNPNQKPSRVFMDDGTDLPFSALNGKPGFINLLDALNAWQLVAELKEATGQCAATSFKHVSPAGAALGIALTDTEKRMYHIANEAWEALDDDNKVSLFVRFADITNGEVHERIMNKN